MAHSLFACRANFKLELSVKGLPAASSSLITVVYLLGGNAVVEQEVQQPTASVRTHKKHVALYKLWIYLLDDSLSKDVHL